MALHLDKPLPGDILVFLTGQDTIEACANALRELITKSSSNIRPLLILPIYASLAPKEQARIYAPTPTGVRKVVLATNIAETSITIDGVVYVVDCGLCKQDYYNSRTMVEELRVVPISQASATQRSGRAGRTQPGECYRLYTPYTFQNELPAETVP
uniref:RNA helicase n=1 Tax=Lygus hesperus TaxID=30085 RepID=A0A0A9X3T7_LYGHE